MIDELLDYALISEITEAEFWSMTIREVNRRIKAWGEREKRHNIFLASSLHKLPQLVAIAVLDSKSYPAIYEIFPDLFDEQDIKEQQEKQKIRKDTETFKAWAESFNRKFKEGNN